MGKLYLCKPNRIILGTLTGLIENSCSLTTHTADLWELSFDVNKYMTDENGNYMQSDYYESITQNMELYLETSETCAFFKIDSAPVRKNDGIQEILSVTAHSIECELQDKILKNFKINYGTIDSLEYLAAGIDSYKQTPQESVTLVNYENHSLSLLHMAIEKSGSTWSIAYNSDTGLCSKKLRFDIQSQDIYSFLMNDVSSAARILFDFDRKNKIISFTSIEALGEDTGITINMKNLMKDFEISSTSGENIITKYVPKGANDLGIAYVNFGEDYILNLDYFMNAENEYGDYQYVTPELHDKYKSWMDFRDAEKITYDGISGERTRREWYSYFTRQYNTALMSKNELINRVPNDGCSIDYTTYKYEELKISLNAYRNAVASLLTIYRNEYNLPDGSPVDENALKETVYWNDYYAYQYKIIPSVKEAMKLYCETDINGNLTVNDDGDYIVLDGGNPAYNNGDHIVQSIDDWLYEWDLYGLDELEAKRKAWIEAAALLRKDEFFRADGTLRTPDENGWNELSDMQKQSFTGFPAYVTALDSYLDYCATSSRPNALTGTNTEGILPLCENAINVRKSEIEAQESILKQINEKRKDLAVSAELKGYSDPDGNKIFSTEDLQVIELLIKEADFQNNYIPITNLDDIATVVDKQEELYQDAVKQLDIVSQPQYSFSCNIDNLFHLEEFEPFADHFKLNNYIYVNTDLYKELVQKVRLITITCNPLIVTENIDIEFSTMTKSLNDISDFEYLLNQSSGHSSSGSSSSGGSSGTYGTNDAEIQIANTMLNALLSTETFGTSVSNVVLDTISANKGEFRRLFANSGVFYGLETGELKVSGNCLVDKIQSFNYDEGISGSKLSLSDGSFDFAGGKFKYNSSKNKLDIVVDSFSLSSGKTIDSIAGSAINDFISSVYDPKIAELQAQIDGQIETWYFDYEPTLSNAPANDWSNETERMKHEGDLFYWKSKGFAYRFFKENNTWKWQLVQDTDITKALLQASKAQDTADGKRRVFVTTPTPPYDVGDLWVQGINGDILRCFNERQSGIFDSADWDKASKYTDDTAVNNLNTLLNSTEEIFNRLTQNGKVQGIFLKDNQLYFNGEYIQAKGLKSINSNGTTTFSVDNNGNVDLNVNSLKILGNNVATQNDIATAVEDLTQEDIFNKLTNNGASKGIVMGTDGQLYFSFSYAKGGELALGGVNNTNGILKILDGNGKEIGRWDKDGITAKGNFDGDIIARSLTLGSSVKVSTNNIDGLSGVATSGNYNDLSGKPTIPTLPDNIITADEVTVSQSTDSNGITTKTITVGSQTYTTKYSDNYVVTNVGIGTQNSDKTNSYFKVDTNGLLEANNAIIYGTVYATNGKFSGNIDAKNISVKDTLYMWISGWGESKKGEVLQITESEEGTTHNRYCELNIGMEGHFSCSDEDENYYSINKIIIKNGLHLNQSFDAPYLYDTLSLPSKRTLYIGSNGAISAASSSRRYKQDISTELDEYFNPYHIYDLPVCQFRYNSENGGGNESQLYIGFIAEDVAKYYPPAARWNENHTQVETWEISDMFPAALKLIQDQHKEIEQLKKRVNLLEQGN